VSEADQGQRQQGVAEIQICAGFPFMPSGSNQFQGTGRRGLHIYSDDFWEMGAPRH